ncbi:hypothetical protein JQN63_29865 [Delftia lacustris]|uniref:hypothetical protein n=1 Tax=Delftia lacustris TaxID=558537 RepID=UPI00193BEF1B|nr:hypothetical protein [Delftia lacustris]QRI90297.1 hypothetical protein JQN63_29865 [Delftia lacustris]
MAIAYPVLHIAGDRGFEFLGESLDFHGALDRLFSGFGVRLYGCIHGVFSCKSEAGARQKDGRRAVPRM